MNDHLRLIERVALRNPVPNLDDPPSSAWNLDMVRREVTRRDNPMLTQEEQKYTLPKRPNRRGWQVAVAAFAAVLAVGATILLLSPGDDVVEPSSTTTLTPTTVPPTTVPPTTPAPDTTTIAPTTSSAPTTAAPAPPLSSGPAFAFFNGANPVTEPGAVAFDGGLWHMFYRSVTWPDIAGNGNGLNAAIGYATSEDGRSWIDAGIITTVADTGLDYVDAFGMSLGSALVQADGTWVVYFHTYQPGGELFSGGVIGRMTAPAPTGPWTVDPAPVLTPGPAEAWDADAVAYPSVLEVGDELWMYYDGHAGDLEGVGDRSIGLATSPDGVVWTKHNNVETDSTAFAQSDPILTTTPDEWDQARLLNATVVTTSEGFVMAYLTNSVTHVKVGLAFSDDGITWAKGSANPVYDGAQAGFLYAGVASFIDNGDGYVLIADLSDDNPGVGSATQVFTWFHEGEIRD